jgi:hypothetical protein
MDLIENSFAPINPDATPKNEDENFGMFALYLQRNDADLAVRLLERNGFKPEDISLLAPQKNGARNFVYNQKNSLIQGAVIGGFIGAVLLGLAGLFFGAKGMFTTPPGFSSFGTGFSPVSAAVSASIGLVLGAASGVLVGIGSPKSAAKRYGFYLKEGGIVLVVHLKDEGERLLVSRILEKTRGQDINILDQSKIWSIIIPEKKKLVYS